MYRSTKGASKARRDQINAEIRNLKELLPISDSDKARLSYLHIMSLACMYTRKTVFFSQEMALTGRDEERESGSLLSLGELSELMNSLPAFLLLMSSEGKLLYLSDNVTEHLGHSMVDLVAQSDSVFDIIDPNDHFILRSNLVPTTTTDTDRLFRCRFNTSKFIRRQGSGSKLTLVRARCLSLPPSLSSYWSSNPVWMCSCSPLEPRTPYPASPKNPLLTPPPDQSFFLACFHSRHARDMKLLDAQDSVSVYLGYDVETLRSRSWYSLLHPRDLPHASAKHCALLREPGERRAEMVVRVQALDGSWVWLYMVLQVEMGDQPITCLNYIISESEAWSVRQQLCLEQNQLALYLGSGAGGGGAAGGDDGGATSYPYPEPLGLSCQSDPLSSPLSDQVFTPSSSGLSAQSFDFNLPTTSSQSSSDELGSIGPLDPHHPHHHHQQQQQPQQQQQQQPPHPSEGFPPLGKWSALTAPLQAKLETTVSSSPSSSSTVGPPPHPHLPPLHTLPSLSLIQPLNPQQKGELVCTPPYTPRLVAHGSFLFGDEQFGFDPSAALGGCGTTTVAGPGVPSVEPPTLSGAAPDLGLVLPTQGARRKPQYGKLPLGHGGGSTGEYTTMALPEIRGPLYVDVPHGHYPPLLPPEGLLTPDASPTTKLPPFPPQQGGAWEKELERLEISLLAQYISAVAEGFYDNPLHPKPASRSPSQTQAPSHHQSQSVPTCELYSANAWAAVAYQHVPEEISLFEESIVVDASPKNSSINTSPSSSPTSTPTYTSTYTSASASPSPYSMECSHPAPEAWTSPCQSQGAQSPIGEYHFSSVQSTRCNHPVGGGPVGAVVTGLGEEEEEGVSGFSGLIEDMEVETSSIPTATGATLAPPLPPTGAVGSASLPLPAPGPSCAQSLLLEELVAMETVFGADAPMAPAVGQHSELYQLSRRTSPHAIFPDGTSDHTF